MESYRSQLQSKGIYAEDDNHVCDNEFTHAYYQGLLLEIGNANGLSTFAPNQDRNKTFAGCTLGDIRSLDAIPSYSYDDLVKRSSTIDVIWFNKRRCPVVFLKSSILQIYRTLC